MKRRENSGKNIEKMDESQQIEKNAEERTMKKKRMNLKQRQYKKNIYNSPTFKSNYINNSNDISFKSCSTEFFKREKSVFHIMFFMNSTFGNEYCGNLF